MCFLEREVYAFLSTFDKRGERVRGAMLRARIFCLREGRRSGRWTGRGWIVGGTREELAGKAVRKRCAREEEEGCFLFLGEKVRRYFLYLLGSDSSRSVAIAASGYRHRREKRRGRSCGTRWKNPACRGLRPVAVPAFPAYRP